MPAYHLAKYVFGINIFFCVDGKELLFSCANSYPWYDLKKKKLTKFTISYQNKKITKANKKIKIGIKRSNRLTLFGSSN